MPQMSPYNWLILMFFFNLIYLYMIIYNYYFNFFLINKKINFLKLKFFKMKW
nr:ATP synthase F0 subunit 8 [Euceros serricornis]